MTLGATAYWHSRLKQNSALLFSWLTLSLPTANANAAWLSQTWCLIEVQLLYQKTWQDQVGQSFPVGAVFRLRHREIWWCAGPKVRSSVRIFFDMWPTTIWFDPSVSFGMISRRQYASFGALTSSAVLLFHCLSWIRLAPTLLYLRFNW